MKPLLSTKADAGQFFGVSPQTITAWIDRGAPVAERHANGKLKSVDLFELWAWRLKAHRSHILEEDVSDPMKTFLKDDPMDPDVMHHFHKYLAYLEGRAGEK